MSDTFIDSDRQLLDLLRKSDPRTVSELGVEMQVTATAVRQRLTRLMGQGFVLRSKDNQAGRGRPVHRYELTPEGRRKAGANFADLAVVLWQELREMKDLDIRRGLLKRISSRMAEMYKDHVCGDSVEAKMESLADLFESREVPFEVSRKATADRSGEELPILTALACPYPELAEQDRGICAMERILISEVIGQEMRLSECRLDGASCCTFEPSVSVVGEIGSPEFSSTGIT